MFETSKSSAVISIKVFRTQLLSSGKKKRRKQIQKSLNTVEGGGVTFSFISIPKHRAKWQRGETAKRKEKFVLVFPGPRPPSDTESFYKWKSPPSPPPRGAGQVHTNTHLPLRFPFQSRKRPKGAPLLFRENLGRVFFLRTAKSFPLPIEELWVVT